MTNGVTNQPDGAKAEQDDARGFRDSGRARHNLPDRPGRGIASVQYVERTVEVGQAVQAARHDLVFGTQVNRHFGAPVLYMQSKQDGPLLQAVDLAEFGQREGWSSTSTKAGPPSQRRSANAVSNIRPLLLEWAVADSPDLYVSSEIEQWISSQQWPDDLNTVWKALQSKVRSEDNNATKNVYMVMMRKVAKIMNDRGNL